MIKANEFIYDGISSKSIGVTMIEMDGLIEEEFSHTRDVNSVLLQNSNKAMLKNIRKEPLTFNFRLIFDEHISEGKFFEVKEWLYKDDYCELKFMDNLNYDFLYYAILNGSVAITHNSLNQAYIEFEMSTNSPYRFSHPITVNYESTVDGLAFHIYNNGNVITPIKMKFLLPNTNVTDIKVRVTDDKDEFNTKQLIITNNLPNETITVHGESEELETISNLRYVYDDHNEVFPYLYKGMNKIQLEGNFSFEMSYQNIYL